MSRYVFKMPDLGEGTVSAEVVAWHVKPGDLVQEDQVMCEVMTEKAAVEMPAPVTGRIISIQGEPGDMVAVGSELVVFDTDATSAAAGAAPAAKTPAPPPPEPLNPQRANRTAPARTGPHASWRHRLRAVARPKRASTSRPSRARAPRAASNRAISIPRSRRAPRRAPHRR
jgi:2-oxoisovalerate dehydrogenase E2 component (dihydrolipoyl transacylase)